MGEGQGDDDVADDHAAGEEDKRATTDGAGAEAAPTKRAREYCRTVRLRRTRRPDLTAASFLQLVQGRGARARFADEERGARGKSSA